MLAAAKREALPAQTIFYVFFRKNDNFQAALVAPHIFAAANTGTINYFLINFKIKINYVPVVLDQKFFYF